MSEFLQWILSQVTDSKRGVGKRAVALLFLVVVGLFFLTMTSYPNLGVTKDKYEAMSFMSSILSNPDVPDSIKSMVRADLAAAAQIKTLDAHIKTLGATISRTYQRIVGYENGILAPQPIHTLYAIVRFVFFSNFFMIALVAAGWLADRKGSNGKILALTTSIFTVVSSLIAFVVMCIIGDPSIPPHKVAGLVSISLVFAMIFLILVEAGLKRLKSWIHNIVIEEEIATRLRQIESERNPGAQKDPTENAV